MTTLERIDQDFKEAMKAKNETVLSTLRLARTAFKNKQIELQHELSESEVTGVLKTMLKQYQDAWNDFTSAGRQDLASRQQEEIDLLNRYVPPAMPLDDLERIVKEAIVSSGATDVGRAMGAAMKAVAGRADGADVRKVVEQVFASQKP